MKKFVLAACIIATAAMFNPAGAQKIVPGVKGGGSFTKVSGLNGDERIAWHAGVFINSTLCRHWRFQPEVLYATQGERYRNDNGEKKVLDLNYIQVPLMFRSEEHTSELQS